MFQTPLPSDKGDIERVPHKLKDIAQVEGYTVGRCHDEIYVIDPNGLMAWPNMGDQSPDSTLGFPNPVPTNVVQFVRRLLDSSKPLVQKIRKQSFDLSIQHNFQKEGNFMSSSSAWLFPGQGSQEIAMGSALKSFGQYFDSAFDLAEEFSGLALRECVSRGPEAKLTSTDHAQPSIIALSVAYVDLLVDYGITPKAVAGHSLGEFAALYAAGVLSVHDTLRLAATRGKLMAESADGTMVAVKSLNASDVQQIVEATDSSSLVVANLNTPEQTIVSGDIASVEKFEKMLSDAGQRFVRLNVSGAWHSPLVAPAAIKFKEVLDTATWNEPKVDVYLGALGERVSSADQIHEIMTRQITSPVYWHKTVESMISEGVSDFLEVGPGKVLRGLMRKAVAPGIDYEIRGVDNKRFVKQFAESEGTVTS